MELEILYVCEKEYKPVSENFIQSELHTHDHTEISIILAGESHYVIDGNSYVLKPGQLVFFNPGVSHSVEVAKQNVYRDFHIGFNANLKELGASHRTFEHGFTILNYQHERKKILEICKALTYESAHQKTECKLMIESLIMQLYVLICRLLTVESKCHNEQTLGLNYPDKKKVVNFITHYINENYMHEISLEMFAKDIYLSQVYISKIFKEETGHSPIHYLIEKRLSTAKQLLETETLPIKTISSKVGYEDAYHFSKLFKKYYGYPPSDIRRKQLAKS